jgi:transcription termination factor Rho
MSVLSRSALEASPLSDLHAIASEVGIDGFRRLRREELVSAILERQGGDSGANGNGDGAAPARTRSRSRSRSRGADVAEGERDEAAPRSRRRSTDAESEEAPSRSRRRSTDDGDGDGDEVPSRSRRRSGADQGRSPARGRGAREAEAPSSRRGGDAEQSVEGVLEILANGSGFIRLAAGEVTDDDVYVSAAQVRRCELVSGDRVAGPARRARRSERHPSLVRVETINGVAAEEVSDGTRFTDLGAAFPSVPIALKAKDATLKQISDLAPIGRGSRVAVVGGPGSGRSTTLRLLAIELAAEDEIEVSVVLAGTRPEERGEWSAAGLEPVAVCELGQSSDAQAQAIDRVIDSAKRIAARGGHSAVVVDSLDQLMPSAARRVLGAARCVPDGGTLTVIAGSREPVAGETTLIRLDAVAAAAERRPVLDPSSFTLRVETLVGARKATSIAKAREKALAPPAG